MFNLQFEENRRKLCRFFAAFSFLLFVSTIIVQALPVTFATAQQSDPSQQNFVFTNNFNIGQPSTFNTISGGSETDFKYSGFTLPSSGPGSELRGFQSAKLFLASSTTTAASVAGSDFNQPISGTFTIAIIRDTPATVGSGTRTNLLTVTVTFGGSGTASNFFGSGGGGTYTASTPATTNQTVIYTSDFLDFSQTNARNFSIGFSSVNPVLSLGPGSILNSFTASGTSTFASDPAPTFITPTAAGVNLGGRVLSSAGRGIKSARVSLTDGNGETRTAVTNSFGYYRFSEVGAGQTVVVAATAKRYVFSSQVVSVSNELTDLNFTALDQALEKSDY